MDIARTEVFAFDRDGNPVEPDSPEMHTGEAVDYDADGNVVRRSYLVSSAAAGAMQDSMSDVFKAQLEGLPSPTPTLADLRAVESAIGFASQHHQEPDGSIQFRKKTEIPYLSHLLIVAGYVWEAGGDTNQVVAAVLHDVLEDTTVTDVALRERFGDDVTDIVVACSDGLDGAPRDASTYHQRKQSYVKALAHKSPRALLVTAADKAHNGSAIVADVRALGPEVWGRFNATPADISWYYTAVLEAVTPSLQGNPLLERLRSSVRELTELAAVAPSS